MQDYFSLSQDIQSALINKAATELNLSAAIIEKDIWVCWILKQLFDCQTDKKIVFKGGTSLSKAYNLIERFSEDIDITLGFVEFLGVDTVIKPDGSPGVNKRKESAKQIDSLVTDEIEKIILPHLKASIAELPNNDDIKIELDKSDKGINILFYYPSVPLRLIDNQGQYLTTNDGQHLVTSSLCEQEKYMLDHVLIEFGGLGNTELCLQKSIQPFLANVETDKNFSFPNPTVSVLSERRTFWEKIVLIHGAINENKFNEKSYRMSRHWYDVFMMIKNDVSTAAIERMAILQSVVQDNKYFYKSNKRKYNDCLNGDLKLVPESDDDKSLLEKDYLNMQNSNMFAGEPPTFAIMMEEFESLQTKLNKEILENFS